MDSFFASSRSNNLNVLVSNDCSEDNQPERVSEKEKAPQNLISENITTQNEISISDDPAKWVLDDATIEYLVLNGVKQNMDIDFRLQNVSMQILPDFYPYHFSVGNYRMVKYKLGFG